MHFVTSSFRQTIRETWANSTEFNYAFFAKMHSKFRGKYLNINHKNWQEYALPANVDKSMNENSTTSFEKVSNLMMHSNDWNSIGENSFLGLLIGKRHL